MGRHHGSPLLKVHGRRVRAQLPPSSRRPGGACSSFSLLALADSLQSTWRGIPLAACNYFLGVGILSFACNPLTLTQSHRPHEPAPVPVPSACDICICAPAVLPQNLPPPSPPTHDCGVYTCGNCKAHHNYTKTTPTRTNSRLAHVGPPALAPRMCTQGQQHSTGRPCRFAARCANGANALTTAEALAPAPSSPWACH